ncbi:receptor-like protein EIX2 [Eucalyptus grandis]|uniref:receptor-like protein EIX2 n=1 Tax=Eucalyptus grandis TaxID=71139 RepID=UPI00192E9388|nr:receptor-like protein EIX2 [Eucalyptus grandis]
MKQLRYLNLSNSFGFATFASEWGNLTQLEVLDLNSYYYMGDVDDIQWVSHLQALKYLDMSGLNITKYGDPMRVIRNIPEALGGLQGLQSLDLSNNLLNGSIPHSLGQLQNLDSLDLSRNSLRGIVSEIHFANLSKLEHLDISNNYLAFEVDSNWIPPFNLSYIGMMSCDFKKEFPQWIKTQVNVEEIVLSNSSIIGALPDWLGLMSINYLHLSYNQINGFLPKFPSYLQMLDLSHNLIAEPIPQDIGLAVPHMTSLKLNDNLLSGPIPTSLCKMELLYELHLARNELVGKIPDCWKVHPMSFLDLSSNKLSGVIPSSLGNLTRLGSIYLSNNSLQGEIPVTMNYCRNLLVLDLGENKISGSVPHWFGPSFQFLQILRLRENMFNGSIPSQLCSLPALRMLDLAVNNLTRTIPNCLGYMIGMKLPKNVDQGNALSPTYEAEPSVNDSMPAGLGRNFWKRLHVEQVMKGIDLDYTTLALRLMVNLDLSSNKLIGRIPEELTLLSKLRGLNLSHNFLFGGIPTMIGQMKWLESLDLSNNHLSGTIPQSFSAFKSLSKLNLSHNNFTGPIPKGNQIQTLDDPSIYADNPLLCGDPLQRNARSLRPLECQKKIPKKKAVATTAATAAIVAAPAVAPAAVNVEGPLEIVVTARLIHKLVEHFLRLNPPLFLGSGDPGAISSWVQKLEKAFALLMCNMLRREVKMAEFQHLRQGSLSVDEYEAKFAELLLYASELIKNPVNRARRFRDGFRQDLRSALVLLDLKTYNDIYRRAQKIEKDHNDKDASYGSRFNAHRDNICQ